MSPPAQKARPSAPRISTACTAGSSAHWRSIGSNRRYMSRVKAFSACGRFKVTVATPPSRPNRMSLLIPLPWTAGLRPACGRGGRGPYWANSQRDHQERIDLLAVEDDEALDKAVRGLRDIDAVEIAAGGEQLRFAIVHDPHREEVGARLGDAAFGPVDAGRSDDVAIAVRLEDVGAAHCHDPVDQHAARGAIDDAVAQPGGMALAAGDPVAAVLDKEIRPFLEPVVVDAIGIGGVEVAQRETQREIVHAGV